MPTEDLATIPDALLANIIAHCNDPLACGSTCQKLRQRLWQDELWANACVARWGEYSGGTQPLARFDYAYFKSFRIAYNTLAKLSFYEGIYSAAGARPYGLTIRIELVNERSIRCDAIKDQNLSLVFQADILETGKCRFDPGAVHGLLRSSTGFGYASYGAQSCSEIQGVVLRATRIPLYGDTCYCGGPFGSPHDLNCGCDHSLGGMVQHLLTTEYTPLAALSDSEVNDVALLKMSTLLQSKEFGKLSGIFSIVSGSGKHKFGDELVSVQRIKSACSHRVILSRAEFLKILGLQNEDDTCLTAYIDGAFEESLSRDKRCDYRSGTQGRTGKATANIAWLVGTKVCGNDDIPMGSILFIIALGQVLTRKTTSRHSACIHVSSSVWDLGDVFLSEESTNEDAAWQIAPNRADSGLVIKQSTVDIRHPYRRKLCNESPIQKSTSNGYEQKLCQPYSGLLEV